MSSGNYNKFTGYHNRRSIRLSGFDYSRPGYYFATICIHDRTQMLFGDIVNGQMLLNDGGKCAHQCWLDIPKHYPQVQLDEFIIMPNHVHGIIAIRDLPKPTPGILPVGVQNPEPRRGEPHEPESPRSDLPLSEYPRHESTNTSPRVNRYQHIIPRSIGSILRGYKIGVTKWFRKTIPGMNVWHRNYYERIIRDEKALFFIRKYIRENPLKWYNESRKHIDEEIRDLGLSESENPEI